VCVQLKKMGERVRSKYEMAVEGVKAVSGHSILCEDSSTLRSLLVMRKPYTDPVNFLQVEVLRRVREQPDDEDLKDCLLLTVNGIAAGMRNTG
jgi:phosphoenolpyruvate carboxylase